MKSTVTAVAESAQFECFSTVQHGKVKRYLTRWQVGGVLVCAIPTCYIYLKPNVTKHVDKIILVEFNFQNNYSFWATPCKRELIQHFASINYIHIKRGHNASLEVSCVFCVSPGTCLQHLFSPSVWNQSPVCSDWSAGRLCCVWSTA